MLFNITLGKSRKELIFETNNKEITMDDVLLLVAEEYGDEWFGCCVQLKEKNSFICNAVEEYFRDPVEGDPNKSVYEFALKRYVSDWKIRRGFYEERINQDDSVTHMPCKIFEEVK